MNKKWEKIKIHMLTPSIVKKVVFIVKKVVIFHKFYNFFLFYFYQFFHIFYFLFISYTF
jgi:hypothetical protein